MFNEMMKCQIDWNHQYQTTEQTVEGQLRKSLDNLKLVFEEAGASVEQLLQVRIYIRGEFGEQMQEIAPSAFSFLGAYRPAVTGIGVASLVSPEVLVEVEAIASIR